MDSTCSGDVRRSLRMQHWATLAIHHNEVLKGPAEKFARVCIPDGHPRLALA